MENQTQYTVSKKFTDGLLNGLTYAYVTTVPLPVGFKCEQPCGGSPYVVVSCERAEA